MAPGIQHIQAAQLFKLPSSSTRGVPELRNKKWLNSNLTCGTSIGGRSLLATFYVLIIDDYSVLFNLEEVQIADSRTIDKNTAILIHGVEKKNQ
jgi:hypothetical protein